ncbi:hypothetical protein [Methylocapsa aurea]|uniref:hypothetical protein n=1 Tax=Methylocapsa aurea TaxID=663610 RepID=UPI003D18C42C
MRRPAGRAGAFGSPPAITRYHIEAIDADPPGAPGSSPAAYSSPLVVNFQLRPDPLAH